MEAAEVVNSTSTEKKTKNVKSSTMSKNNRIFDGMSINHNFDTSMGVLKLALENIDAQRPEVLKPQLLRSLYAGLACLSLDTPYSPNSYVVMGSLEFDWNVKFVDILNLSNFLFKELSRRFNQLFSDLGLFTTAFGKDRLNSVAWEPPQGLFLLLRCCMVVLHLLEFDLALLLEKCQTIFTILSRLCSSELLSHISYNMRGSVNGEAGVTSVVQESEAWISYNEQSGSGSFIPFLCSILEVFLDELLTHRKLRQYFMMISTISSTSDKPFICHLSHGDNYAVLELISAHFLLSGSDEQSFKKSLDASSGWHSEEPPFLELSLTTAMQLLGIHIMFSAPHILHAHMISFIARCIGIDMSLDSQRLEPRLVNCYISAFQRSVILYSTHMSSLQLGGHFEESQSEPASSVKAFISRGGSYPSFESYVRPITYNLINVQVSKFADSSSHLFSRKKPDLVNACIAYMNENQHILDKSLRDEILSILKCIIMRTLSGEFEAALLLKSGDISLQEMYLLASIMKLMSSSLLQTVWCVQTGSLGCRKMLKDYSQCREYDFIIDAMSCFRQYSISQAIEGLLLDVMAAYPARHKESKLMLMHFAGLLLFSFNSGLEFLCKGCIFMMMTLMNLFIFEEGNLDALKLLVGSNKELVPFQASSNKSSKVPVERSPCWKIASKFQKIQTLNYLRTDPLLLTQSPSENPEKLLLTQSHSENSSDPLLIKNVEEYAVNLVEDNTCNGAIYLNCLYGPESLSDFDDLADFIVCNKGKDYSDLLKDRQKYRKFKTKKVAIVAREWKKRSLAILKGSSTLLGRKKRSALKISEKFYTSKRWKSISDSF